MPKTKPKKKPAVSQADRFRSDFVNVLSAAVMAGANPVWLSVLMSRQQASELAEMRNTLGRREFPDISAKGGSLFSIKVKTRADLSPGTLALIDGGIERWAG